MPAAAKPANEPERLRALREYAILDTPADQHFDDLVKVASHICETPMAIVTLVDADRQWFKAKVGLEVQQTSRDVAFCAHALHETHMLEVQDATKDPRFSDNELVTGDMGIRFYAGVPLITSDHFALGTLCVVDRQPRELNDAQREALEALARQVVAMFELHRGYARLRELSRLKDEFLRVASHDLKNPLQAIHGAAAILTARAERHGASSALREYIEVIEHRADLMQRIIEDFVEGQALEDGQLQLTRVPTDIADLARTAVAGHGPSAHAKDITISFVVVPPTPPVLADRARLSQVVENLLGNAIKFSPHGTRVFVTVSASEGGVRLEVVDQGPGLAEGDHAKLFSRYARLSAQPTGGEASTGLGLAISKQLVEAHGGRIGARNNEGAGATFWFEIPG